MNNSNNAANNMILELVPVTSTESLTDGAAVAGRIHHCQQLQIQTKAVGYFILTEHGEAHLQNGDEIIWGALVFNVQIYPAVPSFIVPQSAAEPEPEYEDSWTLHNVPEMTNQQILANAGSMPFEMAAPSHHYPQTDHLSFLYGDAAQHLNSPANSMPATLAMPGYKSEPAFSVPAFNQPINHARATQVISDMPFEKSQSLPLTAPVTYAAPQEVNQHNILQELNINQESSTLINRQYTTGNSNLEQAPVDLLDEYLNLDFQETFKKEH